MPKNPSRRDNPVAKPETARIRRNLGPLFANVEWDDDAGCYASWTDGDYFASNGRTPDEAFDMLIEAIRGHISVAKEYGVKLPLTSAQLRELERAVT
jgi:predicted RNase H-like HicB family nuclease